MHKMESKTKNSVHDLLLDKKRDITSVSTSVITSNTNSLPIDSMQTVNGVVSMTVFLIYKFLSSWRFTFSKSRESKEGNQSGYTIMMTSIFSLYILSNYYTIHFNCPVHATAAGRWLSSLQGGEESW